MVLTCVVTTQRDAIKQRSYVHTGYSDFFSLKKKYKTEDYHTVYVEYRSSCCLSVKQMTKRKQYTKHRPKVLPHHEVRKLLWCLIRSHYRCLKKFSFSEVVPLWVLSQNLLFEWSTTDRLILSTTSLTLFEVLLNMIVLSTSQVQYQSSETRNDQQHWWCQRNLSRTVVCVFFFCETGCLSFSVSTCPPVYLVSHISLRYIDFLWVSHLCQESDLQRQW
jgi:hypothetical protein